MKNLLPNQPASAATAAATAAADAVSGDGQSLASCGTTLPNDRPALQGLRVIDAGRGQAAAVAALLLAECGADVIKLALAGSSSALTPMQAAIWDRSKRAVACDPALAPDRAWLDAQLQAADVLLHDHTPQQARAAGFDPETLARRCPELIVALVTAWPAAHPLAERPLSDLLALAECGLLDEQAAVARAGPVYLRFPLGSALASGLAAAGVVARLFSQRSQGTGGGPVSTSLVQAALLPQMMYWSRGQRETDALIGMPKDNPATLFECSDGLWLHLMGQPAQAPWIRDALAAMGAHERAQANARYAQARVQYMPDWGAVARVLRTRPRAEWLQHLWDSDVPVQPVLPMGALFRDGQALANGYVVPIETRAFGPTLQPAVPLHLQPPPRPHQPSQAPWSPRADRAAPAPTPGVQGLQGRPALQGLPLSGLQVLDFGNYLAGPLATMLLADLGADVIKVEVPSGDPLRRAAWAFNGCQRGKRALALQLKDPQAREVLKRLVQRADVVHHNLRLPAAARLGLDADALLALNPALVFSHVSAYGRDGPRKDWPGYDQLFQAASGWEVEGAGAGQAPTYHRFGMMDHLAGIHSVLATLLALLQRQADGAGRSVAASLLGASLFSLETALRPDGTLLPFDRLDAEQTGVAATRRLYRCRDGWLALDSGAADAAAAQARWFAALRVGSLEQAVQTAAASNLDALLALAARAGIAAVKVACDQSQHFFDNPGHRAAGLTTAYEHPVYGWLEQPGQPWHFGTVASTTAAASTTPAADGSRRPPPLLGQHTDAILQELGFSPAEIANLRQRQVVA